MITILLIVLISIFCSGNADAQVIAPENRLEEKIMADFEWGKRKEEYSNDEIQEVLSNIDQLESATPEERKKLRIVAMVHNRENGKEIIGKYTKDRDILEIVALKDQAYQAWATGQFQGDWTLAEKKMDQLLSRLGHRYLLYLFYLKSERKSDSSIAWFKDNLRKYLGY